MKKYIEEITDVIRILPKKISKKIKLIIILLSFGGLIEMISIGLLIPIISYFLNEKISINFFGHNFDTSILIKPENITFFVLLIGFIYFFKSVYLTILEFNFQKFIKNVNREMTLILYKKYISSKYEKLINQNSAILLRNLTNEIPRFVGGVIEPLFMISKEIFIIFFLLYLIISINFNISLIIIFFSIIFIFFSKSLLQKTLKKISQENQFLSGMLNKSIIESIQGVKLIKSYKVENIFFDEISKTSEHLKRINYKSVVFRMLPRIWIEFVIILALGLVGSIFYLTDSSLNNYLLFTSIFLISMLKIIPSSISIINVINTYNNNNASIKLLANEIQEYKEEFNNSLNEGEKNNDKISFNESIHIKNIYFKHKENKNYILNGLSINIAKKNEIIGIYGDSGSGKTTLIDILIGLLNISEGEYIVDGKRIESKDYLNITKNIFGYVPQNTFIFDETIKNNILITTKDRKYDDKKFRDIIKLVELENFINSLPNGINTLIGENGARISGGQKQRIGIARALINDPKILIFDEATSSVDIKIEKNIFETIKNMSNHFSSVIISHNPKVRGYCNKIYKLEKGILQRE